VGIIMISAAILLLAYAFCASLLLIIGLITESRGIRIAGAIALAPVVAVVLWLVVIGEKGDRRSKDPAWVFEQEFQTPPPREVTALRGLATGINDTGYVYLSFSAPPEAIDALVSNLMVPTSPKDLPLLRRPPSRWDRPPFWWHPPAVPPAKIYMARQVRHLCDGCGDIGVLYYEPDTHIAHYGRL
jgi:hypothetical protein